MEALVTVGAYDHVVVGPRVFSKIRYFSTISFERLSRGVEIRNSLDLIGLNTVS